MIEYFNNHLFMCVCPNTIDLVLWPRKNTSWDWWHLHFNKIGIVDGKTRGERRHIAHFEIYFIGQVWNYEPLESLEFTTKIWCKFYNLYLVFTNH